MIIAAHAVHGLSSVTETVCITALSRAAFTLALRLRLKLSEDLFIAAATMLSCVRGLQRLDNIFDSSS